ncbi:hypothetical protein DH2020_042744 [Rehmannia glutinosa]|uniref:Uncharacterized protein n=1 Tax=Rehmannia glutinosa TaxID=99300 RepID=A0ABR0UMU3_REHGL
MADQCEAPLWATDLQESFDIISPLSDVLGSGYTRCEDFAFNLIREKVQACISAAASAVCTLAMAADAVNGLRHKRLWFPCKYFSLNALFLTLLAVAMKLPQDVNTNPVRNSDTLPHKISSLIFMSTATANLMSSLGSIYNKELLANIGALGILVLTIVANVLIQFIQLRRIPGPNGIYPISLLFPITSMLLLLPTLAASAISVPTIKRDLELKYKEKHKVALRAEEMVHRSEAFKIDNQREVMMKYWVIAETSSPQFVMARSVVCATSTLIPLIPAIGLAILFIVEIVMLKAEFLRRTSSVHGAYTLWILVIQIIGVVVGLIAPTFRWFLALGFKCSMNNHYTSERKSRLRLTGSKLWSIGEIASHCTNSQDKCTKYIHDAKWFILTFCIGVQIMIVLFNKLVVLVFALLIRPILVGFTSIKKLIMWHSSAVMASDNQPGDDRDLNLGYYILLLEGEAELPRWILKNICHRADNTIQTVEKSNLRV